MTNLLSIFCLLLIVLIKADPLVPDYPGHIKYETVADKTDSDVEQLFERFVKDYDRSYSSQAEEFLSFNKMGKPPHHSSDQLRQETAMQHNDPLPDLFDWRNKSAVTSVKNQGWCGSCWAFSAVGNIEGQWALKTGNLYNLSVQQLLDCDEIDFGCNGGLPENAYQEIKRFGGLEKDEDYPYTAVQGECKMNASDVVVKVTNWTLLTSNETDLAYWLMKNGPISVGINAFPLQFYFGGIIYPWKIFCNPSSLDHGVLIVGFGVEDNWPYWIVKNSWGTGWGEQGYFRIIRGYGSCGINTYATTAVV